MDTILQMKLGLEADLAKKVTPIFDKIIRENSYSLNTFGITTSAEKHRATVLALLAEHIENTNDVFKDHSGFGDLSPSEQEEVRAALKQHTNTQANAYSDLISKTSDRQMLEAITEATTELTSNDNYSRAGMIALALLFVKRKFSSRPPMIGMTVTQNAAEASRNQIYKINREQKTWHSVGDSRVRPAHIIANGQSVSVLEPFHVDGDLLWYPGDSSLGAATSNIIGCRCSVIYK